MDDTKTTGVEANLRVQFALAAFMWTAASVMLGVRGRGGSLTRTSGSRSPHSR
ncbi:MAG: hypothetical protein Q8S43_10060 [Actinomycetota bacterium]|nr:hypothetical protein [Actinomycetota bacterium]